MKKTILVVEDHKFLRHNLCFMLKKAGYTTIEAVNGQEAYEEAKKNKPDLVLMDIMMPVCDGFAGLEKLKYDHETEDIPVIMVTAMAEKSDVIKARLLGADDYVVKPYKKDNILRKIELVLSKKLQPEAPDESFTSLFTSEDSEEK